MSGRRLTAKCSRCAKCGKVATAKCAHGGLVFHFCSKACSDQLCSVLRTGPPIGGDDPLSGVLRELGAERPPEGANPTRLSELPPELKLMVATNMPLLDVLRLQSADQGTYESLNDNSFWRQRAEKLSRTLRIPYTSPSVARLAEKYGWRWVVLNYFAQHDYIIETPNGVPRVVPVRRTFGSHKVKDGRIVWVEYKVVMTDGYPKRYAELHNADLLQDKAPQAYAALEASRPYNNTVFDFPRDDMRWFLPRTPSVLEVMFSSDPSAPVLGFMFTHMGSTVYHDLELPLRDRNGEYMLSVAKAHAATGYLPLTCTASGSTRPPIPATLSPAPSMEDPRASGFISFSLVSTDVLRELPTLPRHVWVYDLIDALRKSNETVGEWKRVIEGFAGLCGDQPFAALAPAGQKGEALAIDAALARLRGHQKVELRIPFDASSAEEQRRKAEKRRAAYRGDEGRVVARNLPTSTEQAEERKTEEERDPLTTTTMTLKMKALMSLPFVSDLSPHSSGPLTVHFYALLLTEESELEIQAPTGGRDGDEAPMDSADFLIGCDSFQGFYLEGFKRQLVQSETSRSMPSIELERLLKEKALAAYRALHHAVPLNPDVAIYISFFTPTKALRFSRFGRSVRVPSSHDTDGERYPEYDFLPLTPSINKRVMIPTVAGGPDGIAKRLS